ncbi:Hypothetical predicted protein [Mytilus galloprovincialis]|uniref:C-type lectin domain-containing protein n=1 Tax=Mytilus galloprovincialis TaxID=29158 RepID=A0A8B6CL53_MYTGA|nr:Hypothetical predicted protein [Mytilus galloprovincialis]
MESNNASFQQLLRFFLSSNYPKDPTELLPNATNTIAHCISFGGNLAKVLKPADDEFIKGLIPAGVNYVWVDGSDEGKEGNWTWNNPMETILLDYWGPNRPDNFGSGQDCMIYRYFNGEYLWDDKECTDNDYPFICDI